jgi:hypothetical protein
MPRLSLELNLEEKRPMRCPRYVEDKTELKRNWKQNIAVKEKRVDPFCPSTHTKWI